jgi:hypothetical protein
MGRGTYPASPIPRKAEHELVRHRTQSALLLAFDYEPWRDSGQPRTSLAPSETETSETTQCLCGFRPSLERETSATCFPCPIATILSVYAGCFPCFPSDLR